MEIRKIFVYALVYGNQENLRLRLSIWVLKETIRFTPHFSNIFRYLSPDPAKARKSGKIFVYALVYGNQENLRLRLSIWVLKETIRFTPTMWILMTICTIF
jgi:hypothetical protein